MAESITPTQPLSPTLPVTVPPDDKRREKQKKKPHDDDKEQEKTKSNHIEQQPHKGLFDEYV